MGCVSGGGFGRQSQVGIELFPQSLISLSSCPGFSGQNTGSGISDLEGGVALAVLGVRSWFLGLTLRQTLRMTDVSKQRPGLGGRLQHPSEGRFPLHHILAPFVMNSRLKYYCGAAVLSWDVCWEPSSDATIASFPAWPPKVLEQTLSPLWDELLVFDQLIVDGRREHLQQEPPLVIINVFDHNKFVSVARASPGFLPPQHLHLS